MHAEDRLRKIVSDYRVRVQGLSHRIKLHIRIMSSSILFQSEAAKENLNGRRPRKKTLERST